MSYLLAFIACLLRVTGEDSVSEIAQYDTHSGFECVIAFKGTNFYTFIHGSDFQDCADKNMI